VGPAAHSHPIGVLMVVVAIKARMDSKDLLIGRGSQPEMQAG